MKKTKKIIATSAFLVLSASTIFSSIGNAVSLRKMLNTPNQSYIQSIIEEYNDAKNNHVREYTEEEKSYILAGLEGNGTEESPYLIDTPQKLDSIRLALTSCFKLTADIDLKDIEWIMVGDGENKFSGTLDGDGHIIKNINISGVAFIYETSGATIKNIKFENTNRAIVEKNTSSSTIFSYVDVINPNIYKSSYGYGGGAGCVVNNSKVGKFEHVNVIGGKLQAVGEIGGIVGIGGDHSNGVDSHSIFKYCSVSTEIIEIQHEGGFNYAGGISGFMGKVYDSYTTGNITGTGYATGGIVGCASFDSCVIQRCYSTGNIKGGQNVGGIAGFCDGTIQDCFTLGKISGYGIVATTTNDYKGIHASVSNCYTVAKVDAVSAGKISKCYWAPEITGETGGDNNGIYARTIEQMTWQMNYTGWDFDEVWTIDEGESTPYLKNSPKPMSVDKNLIGKEAPSECEINVTDTELHTITFDYSALDEIDGLESIKIYLNGELVKQLKYTTPEKTKVTGTITIEDLDSNTEYEYYMVAKSSNTLEKVSQIKKIKTDTLNAPVIELSSSDVTGTGITATITAEKSEKQKIQYRETTEMDASEDVYPWVDYTEPLEIWKNKYVYARVTDGNEYSKVVAKCINFIDTKKPEVTATFTDDKIKLTFKDKGKSGMEAFTYKISDKRLNEDEIVYGADVTVEDKESKEIEFDRYNSIMYVKAWDKVGNTEFISFGGLDLEEVESEDVTVQINVVNSKNKDIKVADNIYKVVITEDDGTQKESIETTDKLGNITLKNLKDTDERIIEFTEIEAANGYDSDKTTRKIVYQRMEDLETEEMVTRIIQEDTTENLDYSVVGNMLYINLEKIMVQDRFNIELNQNYNGDETLGVEGSTFIIEEAQNSETQSAKIMADEDVEEMETLDEEKPEVTTNKYGKAFISLPIKSAGTYTYLIKEGTDAEVSSILSVAELEVTYNGNGQVTNCSIKNDSGKIYTVSDVENNFVTIQATKPVETMSVQPYKLTINGTLTDMNLGVTVTHQNGMNIYKEGQVEFELNNINGSGDVCIKIDDLTKNKLAPSSTENVRLFRNETTGAFELKNNSDRIYAKVDNKNNIVKITFLDENFDGKIENPDEPDNPDGPEELSFESTKYVISDNYIDRVELKTPISVFISNITTNGTVTIYNEKNEKVANPAEFIGTGYKVKIEKNGTTIEKQVVVVGDINSDGELTVTDISTINRVFVKLAELNEVKTKAIDINNDGGFTVLDVSTVNRFFVKLVDKLF